MNIRAVVTPETFTPIERYTLHIYYKYVYKYKIQNKSIVSFITEIKEEKLLLSAQRCLWAKT